MGKYTELNEDVFSIFGSNEWKAEGIKTFPNNFITDKLGTEFIRIDVVSNQGLNRNSVSGALLIDIFTPAGKGSKRTLEIADKLDKYLVGKVLKTHGNNSTQFFVSSLGNGKRDSDNPSLFRALYNLTFNYYGVI